MLTDCETTDQTEESISSYVAMDKELAKSQTLKERNKETLTSFEASDRKHINQTDPDCAMMHGVQGSHTSYNVQSVEEATSQKIYARRKSRVEHPFGHTKRNLKTDTFLLRGRDGVQTETLLLATCFNLARMITIFGVDTLIDKFTGLNRLRLDAEGSYALISRVNKTKKWAAYNPTSILILLFLFFN